MAEYEIRFLNADGGMSLFYALSSVSDDAAMNAVRSVQQKNTLDDVSQTVEVWRDSDCIYRSEILTAPQSGVPPSPSSPLALAKILKALRNMETDLKSNAAAIRANGITQESSAGGMSPQ